jgi:hypothetical protein
MYWRKQKALSVRAFRRLPEEEIALVEDNVDHTFVYELLMEDNSIILSEDGTTAFMTEAS